MSRFQTTPNVLARILDGITKSISFRLENAIDATARHAAGLRMQPQYLPIRIRNDPGRRATCDPRYRLLMR